MIITFCGHSDYISNTIDEKRLLNLFEKISKNNRIDFYLGGYGHFDTFALNCAIKYKETHKNTTISFITPYLGKWLDERKDILSQLYDYIIYPNIENVPQKFAILKRNEWMVQQSDYIFCYVKTHYGGAYKTLLYANKHNKPYTNLYEGDYILY